MATKAALGAILLLIFLAALQWRWSGQLSEAEHTRMSRVLHTAVERFTQEFQQEMLVVMKRSGVNRQHERSDLETMMAEQLLTWRESSFHPEFFDGIWLIPAEISTQPMRFDWTSEAWIEMDWPELSNDLAVEENAWVSRRRSPVWSALAASPQPLLSFPISNITLRHRDGRPRHANSPWSLCLRLNMNYLEAEFWPELNTRIFGEDENPFVLQIQDASGLRYSSDGKTRDPADADSAVTLFSQAVFLGKSSWNPRTLRRKTSPRKASQQTRSEAAPREAAPREAAPRQSRDDAATAEREDEPQPVLMLYAFHRMGSLTAAVNAYRTRNLAISMGVLLLLAIALAMVWQSTRRARAQAKRELEFVAGVSHELLTPLAALQAAGQNLRDGVVQEPGRIQTYGDMVQREAGRLRSMVEEVLDYAGMQAERQTDRHQVVDLTDCLSAALAEQANVMEQAGLTIERNLENNLPPVLADPAGLRRAIGNVLANAAKYGAEGGRVMVSATSEPCGSVQGLALRIRDFGPGIPEQDRPHIFEPFYRGQATASATPGSGLGLHLAQRIITACGGRISVDSPASGGSTFTIQLPAARQDATTDIAARVEAPS